MPDVFVADDDKQKSENSNQKAESNQKVRVGEKVVMRPRDERDYSEVLRNTPTTTNPLAAFVVRPKNLKFETQDSEEKILLLLRKHPITNVPWMIWAGIALLAPLGLSIVPLFSFMPERFQFITVVFWYVLVLGFILEQFLNWYFNVYVITDERILDFDFYSLIYKRVSEMRLDKIEDVTFEMSGVVRNIFNFGTVFIQSAGEAREFEFEDTPLPQKVVKLLNELQMEEQQEAIEGRVR